MSQAMNMLEEGMSKKLRNQRTEDGGGDITEEGCVTDHVSVDPESRRGPESLHLGAKSLLLSKVEWKECRIHRKKSSGDGWGQWWRRARKGVGDDIGHSSSMAYGEMKLLTARLGNGGVGEGGNQRLVISEKSERAALKKVTVVEERGVNSLEFTVKGGVVLLMRSEFGREKGQRLPGPLDPLLEDSANVGIRGVGRAGQAPLNCFCISRLCAFFKWRCISRLRARFPNFFSRIEGFASSRLHFAFAFFSCPKFL